ncbi:MAG: cytochrome P450 [Acidimicrobiia bacterium]|nr:cytochrome P450 [Acidimicrobiia bacterium]
MSVATDAPFDPMAQFTGVAGDVRDPYLEFWNRRASEPVALMEDGGFEVFSYELVSQVMRDNVTFPSGSIREFMSVVMGPYPLVGMDEPEHRRLRALVAQAFRARTLAHWDQDLVVPVVDEMIDGFAGRGAADLVSEFTYHYPAQVIAAILGLPREDHAFFHPRALALINVSVRPEEGIVASEELREYFAGIIEDRRANPGTDIISELIVAELDGERLGDEEIFSFLRLLLPAGAETTYRATGSFLYGLLTNPEQLQALRSDAGLMPQAIEESIRWEGPLLITSRECARDTELGGVAIPKGGFVTVNIGSANHDDRRWERPDEFDLFREAQPHIAFGHGVHMCLGMHLARMEMATAVTRLFDRCPNLRPDPDRWDAEDVHIHGERFRSPTTLPVVFDAMS